MKDRACERQSTWKGTWKTGHIKHRIVAAKFSLAKTEMNARRHLKLIKYEVERCGIVEEHYIRRAGKGANCQH